jgi:hypothetical protein
MRNATAPNSPQDVGVTDEVVERLIRLEEQMRHIIWAVEKLASRDAELDASFRATSDRFTGSCSTRPVQSRVGWVE